LGLHAKVG